MKYCSACQAVHQLPRGEVKELADCGICGAKNEACTDIDFSWLKVILQGKVYQKPAQLEKDRIGPIEYWGRKAEARAGRRPPGLQPFDLEKALAGEPAITRDGRVPHRIIHWSGRFNARGYTVMVLLKECTGAIYTNEQGRHNGDNESGYDLFMAPKTRTVWIQILRELPSGNLVAGPILFASHDNAINSSAPESIQFPCEIIGAYSIEITE